MNNKQKTNFLLHLLLSTLGILLIPLLFKIIYNVFTFFHISFENDLAISVLFEIDYTRLFKLSMFSALIYTIIFFVIIFISTMILGFTGKLKSKNNTQHFRVLRILTKTLISSYIPLVGLLTLSDNQFSSLVNFTVLITIATFIFKKI